MPLYIQLAPLHGVTNRVYRDAWLASFGSLDSIMAPFVLAVAGSSDLRRHFKDLLPPPPWAATGVAPEKGLPPGFPPPLVPQLMGNVSAVFAESARILRENGYAEVNWNLGCPYPMVAKKFRGSGLLPHPERIDRFLESLFLEPELPRISVKVRLGRADAAEWRSFMEVLNRYPLASVTVHPRLGTQMYRGSVNLEEYSLAAESCAHPVVYNGDITGLAAFARAAEAFPSLAGVMLGRGALSDPFLPARLRQAYPERFLSRGFLDPSPTGEVPVRGAPIPLRGSPEWLEAVGLFQDDLYRRYREVLSGPAHVLDKMKEAWGYLAQSLPGKRREIAELGRAKGFEDFERAVDRILER